MKVNDLANSLMTPCDNVSIQVTHLSGASFGKEYTEKGEGRRACREFFKNHTAHYVILTEMEWLDNLSQEEFEQFEQDTCHPPDGLKTRRLYVADNATVIFVYNVNGADLIEFTYGQSTGSLHITHMVFNFHLPWCIWDSKEDYENGVIPEVVSQTQADQRKAEDPNSSEYMLGIEQMGRNILTFATIVVPDNILELERNRRILG